MTARETTAGQLAVSDINKLIELDYVTPYYNGDPRPIAGRLVEFSATKSWVHLSLADSAEVENDELLTINHDHPITLEA